ncbi:MAG: carbamoyltransferase HypF [Anaerolineales bacterium]
MAHTVDRGLTRRLSARRIEIRGVVQGVGFRPFVYRLTHEHGILGWVCNTTWGVEMEVEGDPASLERFIEDLEGKAPPISRIESLSVEGMCRHGFEDFRIRSSEAQQGAYQLISPDIATCDDCLEELFDPQDRRHRYPFINCTNCGPRFTIIRDVPYDRPQTTMAPFRMCPDCQQEYDDPLDRRFHAQPNACPVCGPQVTLKDSEGRSLAEGDEAMTRTAALLREGQIVALKGLGGFQLACDATDEEAVVRLRERKRRPHKPFAVMVRDMSMAAEHGLTNEEARELLRSTAAPIVLVPWRGESILAKGVAPGFPDEIPENRTLGLMLPYTPVHHILLRDVGIPLIMTSGNLSEEPIAQENGEALRRLGRIADYFLVHDRDIYSRYDDSVWFVPAGGPEPIRRARGYAPFPIRLPFEGRPVLACGPELKNTFCLTRDRYAFLSQHIGDMQNLETLEHYEDTISLYRHLFRVDPEIYAVDMHPDYMATRYGLTQEGDHVAVQHHHAHLAACLADTEEEGPVIGVIWDGTGYGLDERIWGGEFLVGDARGFYRAAHLQYLPLPGGDEAIRRPYRLALAYLHTLLGDVDLPATLKNIPPEERRTLRRMVERGVSVVHTSSAGRLFDAVSALLGVRQETSYEAQAAVELEMLADARGRAHEPYPYGTSPIERVEHWGDISSPLPQGRRLEIAPLLEAILADMAAGVAVGEIARRFHVTLAEMIADTCRHLRDVNGLSTVALSGGCFQNRLLLQLVIPRLEKENFRVLTHRQVPCNDGGVALGQAVIAHYYMNGD